MCISSMTKVHLHITEKGLSHCLFVDLLFETSKTFNELFGEFLVVVFKYIYEFLHIFISHIRKDDIINIQTQYRWQFVQNFNQCQDFYLIISTFLNAWFMERKKLSFICVLLSDSRNQNMQMKYIKSSPKRFSERFSFWTTMSSHDCLLYCKMNPFKVYWSFELS